MTATEAVQPPPERNPALPPAGNGTDGRLTAPVTRGEPVPRETGPPYYFLKLILTLTSAINTINSKRIRWASILRLLAKADGDIPSAICF